MTNTLVVRERLRLCACLPFSRAVTQCMRTCDQSPRKASTITLQTLPHGFSCTLVYSLRFLRTIGDRGAAAGVLLSHSVTTGMRPKHPLCSLSLFLHVLPITPLVSCPDEERQGLSIASPSFSRMPSSLVCGCARMLEGARHSELLVKVGSCRWSRNSCYTLPFSFVGRYGIFHEVSKSARRVRKVISMKSCCPTHWFYNAWQRHLIPVIFTLLKSAVTLIGSN